MRALHIKFHLEKRYVRGLKTVSPKHQAQVVSAEHHHPRELAQARIAQIDAERPVSSFLVDTFQRKHDYLRISLTERCNLRCFYCMPSEGVELSPRGHILTDDEVIRLATLFVKSGVTKIRLTGGEPTIRKNLVEIVARLNELREHGLQSIGMTTNGIALHRRLPSLVENGLTHLNISLDTLDQFKFEIMTRRRGHDAVMRSIDTALTSGLRSVKLNVVVVKGLNDGEALDFVKMTRDKSISVRFIEFMPFTGNKWDKAKMVPSSELLSRIQEEYPAIIKASDELNDTARSYAIPGHRGSIGFISSMSDHFCGSCNRLRLTADGQIKVCLFDAKEISLRDQMREGASDAALTQTIGFAVRGKKEKHAGMEDIDVVTNRPMILIGGIRQRRVKRVHAEINRTTLFLADRPLIQRLSPLQTQCRYNSTSSTPSRKLTPPRLTHIDASGRPSMVDVSSKEPTKRSATATGRIYIPKVAYDLITSSPDSTSDVTNADNSSSNLGKAKAKARSKGDVLTVAQLAGIMGCKKTSDLIPLCHPLQLSKISVELFPEGPRTELMPGPEGISTGPGTTCASSSLPHVRRLSYSIMCQATVSCEGKTGVEMEALTAVSVGLLTVWDMLKAVAGKEMIIGDIYVERKDGGKSGDFVRCQ